MRENKASNSKDTSQILKYLFTKTDSMSLTNFPYKWEKDFFPPLTKEEKKYMRSEILRWYQTYFSIFHSKLVEAVISVVLKPSSTNEWAVKYNKDFPEEFHLMIQEIIDNNLFKLIENKINKLNDWQVIRWKPIQGKECWEPPVGEASPILKELANISISASKEEIKMQEEEMKKLIELQKQDVSPEVKRQNIMNSLEEYLNKHKKELIRHCNDRLIMEFKSFPYYYGKMDKKFKNHLFEQYRLQFGATNYTELFAKVFVHLDRFVELHGEKEVKKWIGEQWREYVMFMKQDYSQKTDDELYTLKMEEFNKYAFSIDYYAIILFKISMDGM